MKKLYSKPEIIFEDFTLSENIAGNCGTIVNNSSENVCGYLADRDPTAQAVFMSTISGCVRFEDDGDYNGICYHVPIDANNLFNS